MVHSMAGGSSPEQPGRLVRAVILDHDRRNVVVGEDGSLPEMRYADGRHDTTEGTLAEIGRTVLRNIPYVSVDHGYGVDGALVYQTKPVAEAAEPVEPYRWAEVGPAIELR